MNKQEMEDRLAWLISSINTYHTIASRDYKDVNLEALELVIEQTYQWRIEMERLQALLAEEY